MSYLTIPTTFENKFLDVVKEMQDKYINSRFKIKEVQGSLPVSIIGSGRNSWDIPKINIQQLKRHIKQVHNYGFDFCYLLNAACLGNIEYSFSGRKKIIELLNLLVEVGVNMVTVTVPFLAEFIKERYPQLKINTSVYSNIDTLDKTLFWENLGADRITLDPNINRNFSLLKKIRDKVKVDLQLLVNTSCLFSCPARHYHANVTGHFSQEASLDFFPAFSFNERCMLSRLQNPVEFIKTPWIRPEDLSLYADIGINYFKIAGREYPSKKILPQISAYLSGNYNGNLYDLLMGFFDSYKFKKPLEVYIDNNKLLDFIDFFIKTQSFPCADGCESCSYCYDYANKSVKIDKEGRNEYIKLFSEKLKERLYIERETKISSIFDNVRVSRNIFLKILDKIYYVSSKK